MGNKEQIIKSIIEYIKLAEIRPYIVENDYMEEFLNAQHPFYNFSDKKK